ncbi:MAG: hypothetical protein LQ348_003959 [Seirophora lacunosa]|nr:MAG: hypothetical protein LQ348_003959 [Seirophora lacunosa]
MVKLQEDMTDRYIPPLKALAPDSGVYLNEGDWHDPDWKKAFYGANYPRLKAIKAKYDPQDIFYATTAVGSDDWVIEAPGRLCKIKS